MQLEKVTHDFQPIYNQDSRVLMQGTMPSPKSREIGGYYGHPRNRFWKVISDVCGEVLPSTSPANCSISYEKLFEAYETILKYIRD